MSHRDEEYFWGRLPHFTYYSRRITKAGETDIPPKRFIHRVVEGKGGIIAVREGKEIVLRRSRAGRYQFKATLHEDSHKVSTLTFQKWNSKDMPYAVESFPLYGKEIDELLTFIKTCETMIFVDEDGGRLPDRAHVQSSFDRRQIAKVLMEDPTLLNAVLETDMQAQEIYSLARRKKELTYFKRMLDDEDFRESEKLAVHGRMEDAWQAFFERNTWIFGYGLSYVPMDKLDGQSLKARVAGYNITGRGKEVDALMKTVAAINSLCFVEIKTSETQLVREYRPGVFAPSIELAGAVSQIQVTVQRALEDLTEVHRPDNPETGDPTGETLFQFQPRSFLVIGNLGGLVNQNGANKDKFRSFELFRRSLRWPEVMTFDELYARAKFIVDDAEVAAAPSKPGHGASGFR
ncbi:MAG: DUF4263 domain-containing protein [Mesorhizobium sp.]|nr:DUF4263 domain-containing protein [Mesorhizobium sp.]